MTESGQELGKLVSEQFGTFKSKLASMSSSASLHQLGKWVIEPIKVGKLSCILLPVSHWMVCVWGFAGLPLAIDLCDEDTQRMDFSTDGGLVEYT